MPISPARQRNAASQGIALGLILLGRDSVPFDKFAVDLSFEGAWRSWIYAGRFPQVSTDLRNGSDGVWVMTHAEATKRVSALFWETEGGMLTIRARQQDWDPHDPDDLDFASSAIDGDVPIDGWTALAQDFLHRLER